MRKTAHHREDNSTTVSFPSGLGPTSQPCPHRPIWPQQTCHRCVPQNPFRVLRTDGAIPPYHSESANSVLVLPAAVESQENCKSLRFALPILSLLHLRLVADRLANQ